MNTPTRNDIKNPFNFKLVSDRPEPIPDSPLVQVALAVSSSQYYAAATDPVTKKCYVLHVDVSQANRKIQNVYKEIEDVKEWNVACAYFKVVGVFELFYRGANWIFTRKNKEDLIPPWFRNKFINI